MFVEDKTMVSADHSKLL